jgi:hypothetical protein
MKDLQPAMWLIIVHKQKVFSSYFYLQKTPVGMSKALAGSFHNNLLKKENKNDFQGQEGREGTGDMLV